MNICLLSRSSTISAALAHYQAFASSLPHHASLLTSLNKAQSEITDARTRLQETRDALGNRRPDLVQLWSRGQAVEEMMRMLDEMYVVHYVVTCILLIFWPILLQRASEIGPRHT
jgi:hypothetical protein